MEKPSQMSLACFKFIYDIGKRANYANSAASAYLDKVKSSLYRHPNENAFKPDQYSDIINISRTAYRLLIYRPLEINLLNDALNKVRPVLYKSMTVLWEVIDPDTNLNLNLDYTSELNKAAAFLIKTLFEQNKLKKADIVPITPNNNGKFCELATILFSNHVLPDIRPELKKKIGDTTFADVIKIFEQKYLGKPVIKAVGQKNELSDLLSDIVEKCWARINGQKLAGSDIHIETYFEGNTSIDCLCLNKNGYIISRLFTLNYTFYKGLYKSFKIELGLNKDLALYYRNGNDINVDDATIEGFLYAHFKS